TMIGEFMAASTLLGATIKFDGSLTLQARSEGEIPLIMAEYNSNRTLRAIAQKAEAAQSSDFERLLGGGTLAITIQPKDGKRYQGIVPLNGANLAEALEYYFQQSEQLDTLLILAANGTRAAGILLQALPASKDIDSAARADRWQTAQQLINTVSPEDLLELDPLTLLYRLFHEDGVRVLEPTPIDFGCTCSSERVAGALYSIGREEALSIIEEQQEIEMHCEFCNSQYNFNRQDILSLFGDTEAGKDTLH
ncbi:MAG: Hsp33 family molecular chaperone HslO, partial [Pseudomonadales bacterium]